MPSTPRTSLLNARDAVLAIQSSLSALDAGSYVSNPNVQAGVTQQFDHIGNALTSLSGQDAALALRIRDVQQILAFRSHLMHANASVHADMVWNVCHNALPILLDDIQSLLDELPAS